LLRRGLIVRVKESIIPFSSHTCKVPDQFDEPGSEAPLVLRGPRPLNVVITMAHTSSFEANPNGHPRPNLVARHNGTGPALLDHPAATWGSDIPAGIPIIWAGRVV